MVLGGFFLLNTASCLPFIAKIEPTKSEWVNDHSIKSAYIIQQSNLTEKGNLDLMIRLRQNLNKKGIRTLGVIYDEKELDAELKVSERVQAQKPSHILYVQHVKTITHTNSKGGSYDEHIFDIELNDLVNKAIMWKAKGTMIDENPKTFADKIIKSLEKDKIIYK